MVSDTFKQSDYISEIFGVRPEADLSSEELDRLNIAHGAIYALSLLEPIINRNPGVHANVIKMQEDARVLQHADLSVDSFNASRAHQQPAPAPVEQLIEELDSPQLRAADAREKLAQAGMFPDSVAINGQFAIGA